MRFRYLEILNLGENASEEDIKKAYRSLSKKYHPDVSSDKNNAAKFVQITEAYDYLTGQHIEKKEESSTYHAYDSQLSEYELWREQAKERIRQKARAKREKEREASIKFLSLFDYFLIPIVFINLVLLADTYLPHKAEHCEIGNIIPVYVQSGGYRHSTGAVYRYADVILDDFSMRVPRDGVYPKVDYDSTFILFSRIFHKPLALRALKNENSSTFWNKRSFNNEFILMTFIILVQCLVYRFGVKELNNRKNLAITITGIFIVEIILVMVY